MCFFSGGFVVNRKCKCGCGKDITHKHINAKFLNLMHKDRFWNKENPRNYIVIDDDSDIEAGLDDIEAGWDGHKNAGF